MGLYLQELVPGITEPGDDNNYGSAAMQDVLCLQALSKRIHYGKFVAEAKFRANPEQYQRLIKRKDKDAIMHTLTNVDVENKVCCSCCIACVTAHAVASPAAHNKTALVDIVVLRISAVISSELAMSFSDCEICLALCNLCNDLTRLCWTMTGSRAGEAKSSYLWAGHY